MVRSPGQNRDDLSAIIDQKIASLISKFEDAD
jgi:hypothetical protein